MTKEEKEIYMKCCKYDKEPKELITNLISVIQKQQEELEMYKDIKRIAETQVTELADFISYKGKLEQKDKIIHLMAKYINKILKDALFKKGFEIELEKCTDNKIEEECIKQYFEKKAEEN